MATQAIFDAFAELLPTPLNVNTAAGNESLHVDAPGLRPDFSLATVPALIVSLMIKNQDMLKLIVIGGLIETFRRFTSRTWAWFLNSFFITAYFDDTDETFDWMMAWLAKQKVWAKSREIHISIPAWGKASFNGIEIPGLNEGFQKKSKLAFLPGYDMDHWLWYKYTWMSVNRFKTEGRDGWSRREQTIRVSIFTRNRDILTSLMLDAKRAYKSEDEETLDIYGVDQYNDWSRTSVRKKRPLRSIVLEPEIKNMILDDAKEFLNTEKWYTDRGIPYRRGYLLHGIPGSGKTSLIHSIAGELGLDIYIISLAKRSLDDTILNQLICALPARSIALMEDIDAAFHHAATVRDDSRSAQQQHQRDKDEPRGVTLSGLLGALDGVAAQEGRILFATTNRYEALDEALCRPGRMDVHVEFKCATRWQASELFHRFYPASELEGEEDAEKSEKKRPRMRYTADEANVLAARFAAAVPEGQFSMASLQGHLMRFKERPHDAVDATPAFVEKEAQRRGTGSKEKETEKRGKKEEAEKEKAEEEEEGEEAKEKEKGEAESKEAELK